MVHSITITADLATDNDEESGTPVSVTVKGAEFLAVSAVTAIAQEVLDAFHGSYGHGFIAIRPDEVTDETVVTIAKR